MKRYRKEFEYSYALGMTITFELIAARAASARAVYVHPDAHKSESFFKLSNLCEKHGIPMQENAKAFNILSPKENCFVIGEFDKYVCTLSETRSHIVLVSPMNAGNVGTVMRTALGLGYRDVAVIEPCVDVFSPETVRASMGAVFGLEVEAFKSIEDYRGRFSHSLYPFMLTASVPIDKVEFSAPYALVFGNEAHGLPKAYAGFGQSVIIPCTSEVDSLNLSIAAAIGMYEAKRRS